MSEAQRAWMRWRDGLSAELGNGRAVNVLRIRARMDGFEALVDPVEGWFAAQWVQIPDELRSLAAEFAD